MISAGFAAVLFGFFLSGPMLAMASGNATWRAVGIESAFAAHWFCAWLLSSAVAFPARLDFAPTTRRIVARLILA